ncbi:MAG: hypothetical protein KAR33_03075 [Candidatus Thorarchaeota archaeon]|nr:hypothetical protein [Candidatus Thorarchaeota archaeon]
MKPPLDMMDISISSLVIENKYPREVRATIMGTFSTVVSLGTIVGPALVSLVLLFGGSILSFMKATMNILGIVLFLFATKSARNYKQEEKQGLDTSAYVGVSEAELHLLIKLVTDTDSQTILIIYNRYHSALMLPITGINVIMRTTRAPTAYNDPTYRGMMGNRRKTCVTTSAETGDTLSFFKGRSLDLSSQIKTAIKSVVNVRRINPRDNPILYD